MAASGSFGTFFSPLTSAETAHVSNRQMVDCLTVVRLYYLCHYINLVHFLSSFRVTRLPTIR